MKKRLTKYLVMIVGLLVVIFLLQKITWLPSFSNLFRSKPITIDETPILVKEINNLSRLITISAYDEVVVESSKPKNLPSFPGLRPVPDKIVLIGKGKVLAGVDLSAIKTRHVSVANDSVSLLLSAAQIFSVIVNPSDFEIFDEVGNWTDQEVTLLKIKARKIITDRALKAGIWAKQPVKRRL